MNSEWRTGTVVALCRRMLDAREFDALPILADALQDAGCTDPEVLAQCQDGALSRARAERLVSLVYSDETAAAVRWLEQFVRDINYHDYKDENDEVGAPSDTDPHTYEYAIEVGRSGLEEGHMSFGSDAGADFFREGGDNMRTFFRNWSLVTGVPVSDEDQGNISVSCAC
ncbi:hypothetical protein R5W24_003014 [Gemmata sp. JC717]|uniref:hypothetical protein n=1 Tax=Gemmata algarum TaxID=2975278 RepID=UPI0021BB0AFD|nr:hypothetical protein [Gemmata algarum]MDY3553900.1 hypothetical protein [Gemmata algarum]